jgi:hypothetical protein
VAAAFAALGRVVPLGSVVADAFARAGIAHISNDITLTHFQILSYIVALIGANMY